MALEEEEERVWYLVIAAGADYYIPQVILRPFQVYVAFLEPSPELDTREC